MKNMNKQNLFVGVVIIWIIFSAGYIIRDQWQSFKVEQLGQAYQQGIADSVNQLMTEAEKCEPVNVFNQEKEIQVISVECLQDIADQANGESAENRETE